VYQETNDKLNSNEYGYTEDYIIQLAACRAHLLFGEYEKDKDSYKEEDLKSLIPEHMIELHPFEEWHRLITVFYEKFKGASKESVQKQFLILAKDGSPSLEVEYFPAQYSHRGMESKVFILVGVTHEGVGFYSNKNNIKKLQVFHRFRELSNWQVQPMWNGLEAPDFRRPQPDDPILGKGSNTQNAGNPNKIQKLQSHDYDDGGSPASLANQGGNMLNLPNLNLNFHIGHNQVNPEYRSYETNPLSLGPFRSTFFLSTKSKRTKDIEIELCSFISNDDSILSFFDTYNARLLGYLSVASLDDDVKDRFAQVVTLDGISKKIRINSETNGQEIITMFAEKIGLHDTAFFQLSAITDGYDRWIPLKDPVVGEGLPNNSKLTLKIRFFWKNPAELTDAIARNLYFTQIHKSILTGDFLVSENDLIELSALHLQYTYGPHSNTKRYAYMSEMSIKDYIPYYLLPAHSHSSWEKKIMVAHEKVKDLSKEDAQSRYLLTTSTLPNYGITFFSGIIPKTDEECYIGVGKLGMALYKFEDLTLLAAYRFGYELRNYANDGEAIFLKVKPSKHAEEKTVMVVSLQFAQIIDLMGYYEKMRKFEKHLKEQEEFDS